MKKIAISLFLIFLAPFTFAQVDTQIVDPVEDSGHYFGEDIVIEWSSINDYEFSRTIIESRIILEDEVGREVSEAIDPREGTVSSNSDTQETLEFSHNELENFDEGEMMITVIDTWEEEEEEDIDGDNEPSDSEELEEQDTEDEIKINLVEEDDCDEEILINFVDDRTEGGDDEIHVEWDSTNLYCETNTYQESTIELEDENSETVTRTVDELSGESGGEDFTVRSDYTFEGEEVEELESGEVTVNVESDWDLGSGDESTTVSFESLEDEDDGEDSEEGVSGDASVSIVEPEEDAAESVDEDLGVEWVSESVFDDDVELVGSEIEIEGDSGRTTSQEKTIEEVVSEGDSRTNTLTFDADDYSTFDEGEWTLTVEDAWAEDTSTSSITFVMEEKEGDDSDEGTEEDDGDTGEDDSEDSDSGEEEETNEDESDQSDSGEEEETDGDESDQSEHADSDDEVLDQETGDEETVDDESDVDTEDSDVDTEDSDVDTEDEGREDTEDDSESFDSGDESDEGSEQGSDERSQGIFSESLDAVAESSPVIWLALAALLGVFMFWRSDYKLDF